MYSIYIVYCLFVVLNVLERTVNVFLNFDVHFKRNFQQAGIRIVRRQVLYQAQYLGCHWVNAIVRNGFMVTDGLNDIRFTVIFISTIYKTIVILATIHSGHSEAFKRLYSVLR